jgi:hypothetical protein
MNFTRYANCLPKLEIGGNRLSSLISATGLSYSRPVEKRWSGPVRFLTVARAKRSSSYATMCDDDFFKS